MKKTFYFTVFLLFAFLTQSKAQLQLFDFFEGSYPEGLSKVVQTDDGGWITIFLQSQPVGSIRHNIVLAKYDPCGEPLGSEAYHFPASLQLDIAGVHEDVDDSFWVLCVGRLDNGNYAGLVIHFNAEGAHLENRYIRIGDGYVPYTINRNQKGELTIFGNVVGPGDSNSSIIAFDDQLNISSAKRILGTGTWGTFLPTSDGGYMCRSGTNYYKIDQNFQQEWIVFIQKYYATNEPIEVEDGYVFCVYTYSSNSDQNFLFKFGFDGKIIWQSPNLMNTGFAKIKLLPNGNFMQIGRGIPEVGLPAHIVFSEINQEGELVRQKSFNPDLSFGFRGEDFIRKETGAVVMIGRTENGDQLVQSLTTPQFGLFCGDYNHAMSDVANEIEVVTNGNISAADINLQSTEITVQEFPAGFSTNRICFENFISFPALPGDTSMCFGDSLRIDLRFFQENVLWNDGSTSKFRMLAAPGEYEVTAMRCAQSISQTISIEASDCKCTFFLPNVFTPNGDSRNDVLELFASCPIETYEMLVFDRWGSLIYQSNDLAAGWDGKVAGNIINTGVYIVHIQFSAIENGAIETHQIVKDITLIR